jgi:hypothetical protein
VKIVPSNQTLILAGEGAAGKLAVSPRQGADPSASGPVLQRVTVVTALPDSTMVYVHADYAAGIGRVVAAPPKAAAQSQLPAPTATSAHVTSASTSSSDSADPSSSDESASLVQLSSTEYSSLLRGSGGSRDPSGNPHSLNQNVNLYAQTQLINNARGKPTLVDVHA